MGQHVTMASLGINQVSLSSYSVRGRFDRFFDEKDHLPQCIVKKDNLASELSKKTICRRWLWRQVHAAVGYGGTLAS
jgi:hypothetical protein